MTIHHHTAAGIDLGSNTFRLLVADCALGGFRVLVKEMAPVRLGRGLAGNGQLHEKAMEQGLDVLRTFRETLTSYRPQSIRICGTEALRQAKNSEIFLRQASEILQHPIEILPPEAEGRLSLAGAMTGYPATLSGPLLLVDVGGGSTELIFAEHPTAETRIASLGLGVVGLTEKFFSGSQPDLAHLDSHLNEILHVALENLAELPGEPPVLLSGCGGTATSMAALDLNLASYDPSLVHGHVLQNKAVEKLWHQLIRLPPAERNELPCLGQGRGEILPAGIRIYHVLLKLLQQDGLRVSDTGLLEGILLSSLDLAGS
jgi:exopolyphosphatase/guanosine-5'-triphosphate,3'-diphosphate pyrophosphatase